MSPVERWSHNPESMSWSSQSRILLEVSESSRHGTKTRRIGARFRDVAKRRSCGNAACGNIVDGVGISSIGSGEKNGELEGLEKDG